MKKNSIYMDRALKSRDPRYARILDRLGYQRRDMVAEEPTPAPVIVPPTDTELAVSQSLKTGQVFAKTIPPQTTPDDDIPALRAKYKQLTGKSPYYGWNADILRERIAKAQT